MLSIACALFFAGCDRPETNRVVAATAHAAKETLNYHALVIGIDDYSGTGWPQLGTPKSDAKAIGDVLRSHYGFNVTELINEKATRGAILRSMDQFMSLTDKDALLIYFAGHGFYDKQMDEGYWIPYGAQRSRMQLPAKEDWLWNSSISRLLDAMRAKHVLLVADTCYGGSLFRGEETQNKSTRWYQRAVSVPSRYLITSGNLEPVLDSGIRHSIFAQQILNYLNYAEPDIFSASDIAVSIRSNVSQFTGQLVRMGPLSSPAHAGGEFVFVRSNAPPLAREEMAVAITNSATVYRTASPGDRLEQLTEQIQRQKHKLTTDFIRPRILACLGPTDEASEDAALIRNGVKKYLDKLGGCILVEREAFNSLLHEMDLGRSGLADQRATVEIGKLLPASFILFGEIIPLGEQKEIHLRIVDTETSRVLCSATSRYVDTANLDEACRVLAIELLQTMNSARPILFPARLNEDGHLIANWGQFHGARVGDRYQLLQRSAMETIAPRETAIGTAHLSIMGEDQSVFLPEWINSRPDQSATVWLKPVL